MENKTEGLVGVLATLAIVEQVLLYVVQDWEQRTTGSVRSSVLAIWASNTLGERS